MDSRSSEEMSTPMYFQTYPLSHGQRALWSLYKMAPESVAYNLSGAVAVPGNTDLDALYRAFQRLAERHPMLHTLFAAPDGEPVQHVTPHPDVDFRCEDASDLSPAQLDERLALEIYRPFDLEQGPTWRVLVLQRAPISEEDTNNNNLPDHLMLLVLHHIIGDLWSIAVMMSEIAALYREETTGIPASLKPLRASYADHVNREAEMLAGPQADTSWEYWHTYLSGDLPPLDLPTDQRRPPVQTGRGAVQPILIDEELADRLRGLAGKHHVALYTVLLAAFQTLLHRYTEQDDILVGFPKAGRSRATARVVGYFVNPLVMRADFTKNPRFADLLQKNQQAIAESSAHDWYPFSQLVQRIRPTRDPGRSPIFQVMFSWQKTTHLLPREHAGAFALGQGDHAADLGGLLMRPIPITHQVAPFDLTMSAAEVPGGLVATIEYNTDLFDATIVARMAQSFRTLLESITIDPDQVVSALPIIPDNERQQLLRDWNATAAAYRTDLCLHQLFEQQAERTPQALALVSGPQQLTYRQLNQQANQLAHSLLQQGVGPETPVGLFCERSAELLIGLLAILKAGAAYVPLDPSYPQDRLAFLLHDSNTPLLVTHSSLRQRLTSFTGTLVCLDADATLICQQPETNPLSPVTPDSLAYLIYTSGSTGQPNGVALAHRGVVSLLTDCQQHQVITPGDACSWWTSMSFDVSLYEIFSAWQAGGTLHVIPETVRLDVPTLLDWLHTRHIRSAYLPAFLLADFAAWLQSSPTPSAMRRLLVGVEPIAQALLVSICRQLPDLCLLNGYGPTETTICSTLYVVDATSPSHQQTPIGRPVANTQLYLLDRHLQPVPIGVVGEVYIAGVGLARGYLNRPELTAERFLSNPFSTQPGTRLYRTGDLARYLPDGNLEFIGRRDSQVKLRGYRLELGEIEATLAQHPNVKQAAVLVREDQPGNSDHQSLVAFWTPRGEPLSVGELRSFLRDRLPKPMIPAAFVMLDTLPLLPGGKVDRHALSVFAEAALEPENEFAPPRNPLEQYLAQVWKELLKIEKVGIHDDFFELGGNSLLGAVLVNRLQETLRENVSLVAIFNTSTISELARYLEESHPDSVARFLGTPFPIPSNRKAKAEAAVLPPALVPIQPKGTRPPLFCIHPAGGVVFPYYTLVPHLGKDQPLYGIQDPGLYDKQSTFKSIEDMASYYLEALKTVQRDGPYHLMGWSVGGLIAYEMAQQLMRQGQKVAVLIMLDTNAPAHRKPLEPQARLRKRLQRLASWVQALPNSIKESGSAVNPIISYIHSGLFLLAASARRKRPASDKKPTAMDLLGWAGMDTWRARLLKEAEVANTVSLETSLLLVEMPAVRRILELVREHMRLARLYSAEAYRGRITLFRARYSEQGEDQAGDPALGWGKLAESRVELHTIHANHVALLVKPYVGVLAQELRACLDQSRSSLM